MHLYVHCNDIYNSQVIEATQVSTNRWLGKEVGYIYTIEYYSAIKKGNLAIYNNMHKPRGYYAKWKKSDWETNTIRLHLYVESKKQKWTNKTKTNS